MVPSAESLQTVVATETKVVAFEVQAVGSPEPPLTATLKVKKQKGKKGSLMVLKHTAWGHPEEDIGGQAREKAG